MIRGVLLAGAALSLVACAAPHTANLDLSPRGHWNTWVANNVTVERPATLPAGVGGWYDTDTRTSVLSLAFLAEKEAKWPGAGAFTEVHEDAHAFVWDHGLRYGASTLLIDHERGANCVAQIVTGTATPQPPDAAAGYWICPEWALTMTRDVMVAAGAWA